MRTIPSPFSYDARAYGAACVVNLASPTSSYHLKPTDRVVLVNLTGYEAGGPTIVWYQAAEDDFEVQIRNVAGSVSTHNITITPPVGWIIEDPASIGTFVSSLVFSDDAFESGTWKADRKNKRLFLCPPAGAAGAPLLPPPSVFLAPGTVDVPPGARAAVIDLAGNGGGGGGGAAGLAPSASEPGGGSGGGGQRETVMVPVTPGDTLTVAGISTSAGGAAGDPGGSGTGGIGTNATDITVSAPGPVVLARAVGGSGGQGASQGASPGVAFGGLSITHGPVNFAITGSGIPIPGSGFGSPGGQFQNPGGGVTGNNGIEGFMNNSGASTSGTPAAGGAGGAPAGGSSGGAGGGGGGTGGHDIGGVGGAGAPGGGNPGADGGNAPANSGGGGGGGGAGSASDAGGGFGGAGGLGAAGQVTITFI